MPPEDSGALWSALCEGSAAMVAGVTRTGSVVWSNCAGAGAWFPRESHASDPAWVFIESQPGVMSAVMGGVRRSFRGVWRGVGLRATVVPIEPAGGDRPHALVVAHPAAFVVSWEHGDEPLVDDGSGLDLNESEAEVLSLIGRGLRTRDIASVVRRSEKTIEARRSALGKKLGAETRGELVRIAIRAGLSRL
jgi:DNA-binding CsgD family transcriptional regulator